MSIEFMLDRLGGMLDRLEGYVRSIEGYVGTIAIPRSKPTPVACTIQIDRQSTLLYVR
jgi:hypothetical protein